ncbi:hypothetical protein [Nocardia arizonensis]|uniref:hypothetical protein n=1 Tax=Nocardia arizonensis TaxID=1141647 RepID=UPI0006D14C7F|nr:hypothetical protein [Nocardia arizonensis]
MFTDSSAGDRRGFADKNIWENITSVGAGLGSIFAESYRMGETLSWVREHDPGTAAWYLEQQQHDQALAGLAALIGTGPAGGPSAAQAWGGLVTGLFATPDFQRGDYAYAIPKAAVNVFFTIRRRNRTRTRRRNRRTPHHLRDEHCNRDRQRPDPIRTGYNSRNP